MVKVTILLLFLVSEILLTNANINVVMVAEEKYEVPRTIIPVAVQGSNTNAQLTQVHIRETMSEMEICKMIFKEPPTVVLDTMLRPRDTNSRASSMVKKVVRRMGVPTVSATYGQEIDVSGWETLSADEKKMFVQIPPPGDYLSFIIRSIAMDQNMTTVGVLYDDSFVMEDKYSTLLKNHAGRQLMNSIPRGNRAIIQQSIERLRLNEIYNFFVMGTIQTINNVMEVVQDKGMYKRQYGWFFITKDDDSPKCSNCVNATALFMKPALVNSAAYGNIQKQGFPYAQKVDSAYYFDLAQWVVTAVAQEIGRKAWPSLTYPDCAAAGLSDDQKAERAEINLAQALSQNGPSSAYGPLIVQPNSKNYQGLRVELEKVQIVNSSQKIENIGSWDYVFGSPKMNFAGNHSLNEVAAVKLLKITTLEQAPFIIKKDEKGPNGEDLFYGYCIDLIDYIKEIVMFEYDIFETKDKVFGEMTMDKNVNWTGMIGDLYHKRADIALGPLSVMAERETVVDFTVPYYDLVGISILMKKPQVQSSLFKFLTVLETNVWGCILGAYFFTSFLMYLFDRLSPYSFHNNREKYKDDEEKRDFNIKECMWFCMTSLTPQGGGEAPRNLSGRLVAATWWLFGFIIIASYTANLAAFLTVSRLDSTIESLDDLAKQYKIKYAPEKGSAAATYFERMAHIEEKFYEIWKNMSLDDTLNETERAKLAVWDYPVSDKYTKIWWTMRETKMPESFEEGVEMVKASKGPQDGFAFIADSTQVKYAVMTNCDLLQVGNEFSRKPLALAVQQGSDLKDKLSSAILKLLNQRKLEALKERWWNKNPAKAVCDDTDKQSDGISIANIGGVFIVIFIGVVLACITLAIEYWYYKQKRSSSRVVAVKEYGSKDLKR